MTRGQLAAMFERELGAVDDAERRAEWRHYLAYHSRRYAALMLVVGKLAPQRVLNVGPMFETRLLRETGAAVDTLGFPHPLFPPGVGERHIEADLNELAVDGDASYDAIVMAEVIEHLYTSPVTVLEALAGWMRPGGAIVLQTPNAVALHKRLRMLVGRNPIEPIRADRSNPGHFHEYTIGELRDAAREAGLELGGVRTENYFGASQAARAYAVAGRVLPPSLRHGITLWLRRAG
jgi:SAM-dependent methyltransferase